MNGFKNTRSSFHFIITAFLILNTSCKAQNDPANPNDNLPPSVLVTVLTASELNDVSSQSFGMCITENWEDQTFWNYPVSPSNNLKEMNTRRLRYGSDQVFWSESPWTASKPNVINYGPEYWLSQESEIVEAGGKYFKSRMLDFDEFIAMCRETNSEPEIIVPYNLIYSTPAGPNSTMSTKEDFLKNAEEWVRYANVVKGYNVKYWEIGNESWNNTGIQAAKYRDDAIIFSRRMKAVDPSIKIIANGNSTSWFKTVLEAPAGSIDYLCQSFYPCWDYKGGYSYYKNNDINFSPSEALNAIANSGKDIKLIVTEFNAIDWNDSWKNENDLGHALASFQIYGDILKNTKIQSSIFWNLRWYWKNSAGRWLPEDSNPPSVYNAADKNGNLNANGKALAIWGNNLFGKIVEAKSSNQILKPFACFDSSTGALNVFIINKDTDTRKVQVSIPDFSKVKGKVWVFKGALESDRYPVFTTSEDLVLKEKSGTISIPPTSIVMVKFL